MRIAILLLFLSACSLIDAFTGQQGPFKTFEHVRLPGDRSAEVIAVRGKMIAASGGPDVTFLEHRGSGNISFGSQILIPDNRRPRTMAMAATAGMTGSPNVAVLGDQGIDVIAQDGTSAFCPLSAPLSGGGQLAIGDMDGDGNEDIAVLQEFEKVIVFFGAGTAMPAGLDCTAFVELPVSGVAIVFARPQNGPRLIIPGEFDLIQISPMVGNPRVLEMQALPGESLGAQRITVGDIDGDGAVDLLRVRGGELSVSLGAVETFSVSGNTTSVRFAAGEPHDVVTFRNGDVDSIAITQSGEGSGGLVVFVRDGSGFDVTLIDVGFDSSPFELFATDLDGDTIDDLVGVSSGDIVLALTAN